MSTSNEKQKIVLKALIMLTYVRQFEKRVRRVFTGPLSPSLDDDAR